MAALLNVWMLFLWAIFSILTSISAEGVFELKLLRFINDEGLDQTGNCCVNPELSNCTSPCRTAFRICLTHYQTEVDQSLECTFGKITTPVLGENSFNPERTSYIQQHPVEFSLSFRWPGSFSLVIDVFHENEATSNQAQDQIGETVITRLVKSAETFPVKDGPNTWTRPEPYRHRQSVLQYEYRVVCAEDQYGPDCATFCRARNDQFGHYGCSADGERECLRGWTKRNEEDIYCMKAVCSNCDSRRGACTEPEKCECLPGWTGEDCSLCLTLPNCVHGTCDRPFACKCNPGWGGSFCNQDLNYCTNNQPCRNGATCTNTGEGSYSCKCRDGYIGTDCQVELDECDSDPCQNGAHCVDVINDYKCVCRAGYYGRNCESTSISCVDSPCLNGGTCSDTEAGYECECAVEWTDPNCGTSTSSCSERPCKNNGTCEETSSGYNCVCEKGFTGANCEISIHCSDMWCLNGGRCLDSGRDIQNCHCHLCKCKTDFAGTRCERNIATDISEEQPNSNGQLEVVYSKKTTTYIEENHTETRIVGMDQPSPSFTSKHWIAICGGSVALVLVLIAFVSCLIYYKRKSYSTMTDHHYKQPNIELQTARNIDLSIIADNSPPESPIIRERSFQKPLNAEIRRSTSSFQQKAEKSSAADGNWESNPRQRSDPRSSGKLPIVLNDGHCCKRYSHHYVQPIQEELHCAVQAELQEMIPLRRVSIGSSSPMRHSNPESSRPLVKRDRYSERPRSLRHSMSQPPTYEEVCREKDALVRSGVQQTNSIVI